LDERLEGVLKTSPSVHKNVETQFYSQPFTERDFENILRTSKKAINVYAVRGGIDTKGDVYAWRYDVWIRPMGEAHGVKFNYEIEAIKEGSHWKILVKATTSKMIVNQEDIINIDNKVSDFANRLPGIVPMHYQLSNAIGKDTMERKIQ